MKSIIVTASLIITFFQLQVNAEVLCQSSVMENEYPSFRLESAAVSAENVQLITFSLAGECYVTISVNDRDKTQLAEGEMDEGSYNVYYKCGDTRYDEPAMCIMEIYRDESKSDLICKKQIELHGK